MVDQCSTNRSQAAVRPGAETLSGENGQANRTEEAEEQIMSLTKNRTAARGQFFVLDKINETEQRRTKTSYFWTATSKAGRTTHEAHKHEKEKAHKHKQISASVQTKQQHRTTEGTTLGRTKTSTAAGKSSAYASQTQAGPEDR
jgi:hypothetical protein